MLLDAPDLASYSLLTGCSDQSLAMISEHVEERVAQRGETLFFQGDPCPGILLIADGAIRLSAIAPCGKEHVMRIARQGDSLGEVIAAGGGMATTTATVLQETRYLLIPTAIILDIIDEDHGFCQHLLTAFADRVRSLTQLMHDIVLRDAVGRVANYLSENADADGTVTMFGSKRDLALHLNLTPETLSRAFKRLQTQGLIRVADYITIEDRPWLLTRRIVFRGFFR